MRCIILLEMIEHEDWENVRSHGCAIRPCLFSGERDAVPSKGRLLPPVCRVLGGGTLRGTLCLGGF